MLKYKTLKDYYDKVQELYPEIPKEDIKTILQFMWKQVFLTCHYGADVTINTPKLKCYIGNMRFDSVRHHAQYINKLSTKLRILFKRKKVEWDGYYYFALTDKEYESYLEQKKRRIKKINYGNQVLFKIYDECSIKSYDCKYIFKVPAVADLGYSYYKENYTTKNAELVTTRDKLKFKDILVSNYKYQFL